MFSIWTRLKCGLVKEKSGFPITIDQYFSDLADTTRISFAPVISVVGL